MKDLEVRHTAEYPVWGPPVPEVLTSGSRLLSSQTFAAPIFHRVYTESTKLYPTSSYCCCPGFNTAMPFDPHGRARPVPEQIQIQRMNTTNSNPPTIPLSAVLNCPACFPSSHYHAACLQPHRPSYPGNDVFLATESLQVVPSANTVSTSTTPPDASAQNQNSQSSCSTLSSPAGLGNRNSLLAGIGSMFD